MHAMQVLGRMVADVAAEVLHTRCKNRFCFASPRVVLDNILAHWIHWKAKVSSPEQLTCFFKLGKVAVEEVLATYGAGVIGCKLDLAYAHRGEDVKAASAHKAR